MVFINVAKNWKVEYQSSLEEVNTLKAGIKERGVFDDRHDIFCIDSDNEITGYLNYIDSIRAIAQTQTIGRYRYMLELGYIPVVMPPTSYGEKIHNIIVPKLRDSNIPHRMLPASSFNKIKYSNMNPDVWVSKMSLYTQLGCRPEEVTVRKLLEVIL